MKLLRVLHALLPPVQLRVIENLSRDLREPWETALRAHRQRRRRECRKVSAPYWPQVPDSVYQPSALEHALTAPSVLCRQAD
jgi:hypothetical protein